MKCTVDDCPNPPRYKQGGFCNTHLLRHRRGKPLTGLNTKSDWGDKFLAFCAEGSPDECWEWTGSRRRHGYGAMNIARVAWTAHRLSYALHYGDLPAGAFICHRCDNPPCVNPAHLYAGTPADNVRDIDARDRRVVVRGERNGHAVLTEQAVLEIRALAESGVRHADIADEFGVSKPTISAVATRRNWRHVA